MVNYKGEPHKQPLCPYCYNGIIEKDPHTKTYYCNTCKRETTINTTTNTKHITCNKCHITFKQQTPTDTTCIKCKWKEEKQQK
jgi:hypothetical protein